MLAGWAALSLPTAQEGPVRWIDTLFITVSAVSTTGLVTVDPCGSFVTFGEAVMLVLMPAGGLGDMTIGSFAYVSFQNRLTSVRARGARAAFGLPSTMNVGQFLRAVFLCIAAVQAVGALALRTCSRRGTWHFPLDGGVPLGFVLLHCRLRPVRQGSRALCRQPPASWR